MPFDIVPDSAPFSPEQRAWLNGFLAGMLGMLEGEQSRGGSSVGMAAAASMLTPPSGVALDSLGDGEAKDEDFPWHDSALPIVDRMQMAEGRPVERQMLAAMAQLDCGSCGYLCKSYAEAIVSGTEKNLTLCSPGGGETAKMLRQLNKNRQTMSKPTGNASGTQNGLVKEVEKLGTRNKPVVAKLIRSVPLNKLGSAKDTRHVEIDLSDTGLSYEVGDALGLWPSNCDALVAAVIEAAKLNPDENVLTSQPTTTLADELKNRCLRSIQSDLVDRAIERIRERPKQNGALAAEAALCERLAAFAESEELDMLDVLEFFELFPKLGLLASDLIETLSPIRPRLYSIASSQSLHSNQVHLTVGRVENDVRDRKRKGVASTMLSDRLQPNEPLRVFVQPSHGFTIPTDPNAPMIMVGPGTGIAPFMAFLQQRSIDNAKGKNWLLFGDQRRAFDYLYEKELEAWHKNAFLTRLDLAFSRDGADKLYVQHRMKENGAELFEWLEAGAYFFICGDASRMAVDVDRALNEIISEHGHRTSEQAKHYLWELTNAKRYVRDVY